MKRRRGAVAVVALVAYVVAWARRGNTLDVSAAFFHSNPEPGGRDVFGFDVFDPFQPGHGYLWLGSAVAFTVLLLGLTLLRRRGLGWRPIVAVSLAVAAVGCAAVTLAQRHDSQLVRREFEGASFDGGGGDVSYSVRGTDLFAPFTPLDAYLWLGLTAGFALGALIVVLPVPRNPRHRRE